MLAESCHSRVVSAMRKNGTNVPVLMTSSRTVCAGMEVYCLLFENLSKYAIARRLFSFLDASCCRSSVKFICDSEGFVVSATENIFSVMSLPNVSGRELVGHHVNDVILGGVEVLQLSVK